MDESNLDLCPTCGTQRSFSSETFDYLPCGIPNIKLKDIDTYFCDQCETLEHVFNRDDAERSIAGYLISKPEKLTLLEAKFLLNYTAEHMEGIPYYGARGEA